ncbi:hypothetical protein BOX30_04910 [Leptospirillum ferriphilum]|uniref:Uncharacterized protein n=1 Tax=Leptospirillum ferriphilum TaxID=178606 RepID=A0A1V3SWF5_9BACT|nr:hypothetical protein ABH19_11365 [Leptospirillum sp. Group II 'CF-1']OOH72208.1 hypothetical protein BOX24_07105 [Leptospirillum ferriphilum]OOH81645.1 hypothetical protein BOX30_04910 [Leptospirillum ferriphilum]
MSSHEFSCPGRTDHFRSCQTVCRDRSRAERSGKCRYLMMVGDFSSRPVRKVCRFRLIPF